MKPIKKFFPLIIGSVLIFYGARILLKQMFGIVIPMVDLSLEFIGGIFLIYVGITFMLKVFDNNNG